MGPGRGTNGWGRCTLGEKAFSSDPRGCLGVLETPSCGPSSACSGHRCGVTTVACWAEPPLREGSAGPAVGLSTALCLPRPAPPPSESGEDPAGPGRRPVRGARACVRVRACACACGRSLAVPCLPRGGAPPRVPPPRAARAAVSRPLPSRVATGGGVWARVGPLSPGGCFPLGRDSGMDRTDGRRLRWAPAAGVTWGLGPSRGGAWFAEGGGPPRVLRPAGVLGVAGPLSCWWRWDPAHVYPVARFAPPLARTPPPNRSPHALPNPRRLCAPSPSPPAHPPPPLCARLDQMAEGVSCPRSALSGPKPASPLLGVVPSPAANGFVCGGGGRPRAKCSRPLVRRRGRARVAGRAGCVCGGGGLASLRVRESVLGAGRDGGVVVAARAPRGCQGPPGAGSVSSGAMGPPLCWRPWAVGPRVPRWPTSGFEAPLKGP